VNIGSLTGMSGTLSSDTSALPALCFEARSTPGEWLHMSWLFPPAGRVNATRLWGFMSKPRAGRGNWGVPYLMDAWAFERPGRNWSLASEGLPSVFHPPEARGNLIYAVGLPFLPRNVQKGDCDQDRPA
jgi:hypothetical protein